MIIIRWNRILGGKRGGKRQRLSALDRFVRQKRDNGIESLIESLGKSINIAVVSIRRLETEIETETTEHGKEMMDLSILRELFRGRLASFEEYNPKAVEPFMEKLSRFLSSHQVDSINQRVVSFDFDRQARESCCL